MCFKIGFRRLGILAICLLLPAAGLQGAMVSFLIKPDDIDGNSDGFITGTELSPIGDDGTLFTMVPTNNLVGSNRFLLNETRGLQFGGGGGSTLSFDFTPSRDILLESYTLASDGFFLGNPLFDIREGTASLSTGNTAIASGDTHAFAGGPLALSAGTTYSFNVTVSGAAVQSYMASWNYTPEPASLTLLGLAGLAAIRRRRN